MRNILIYIGLIGGLWAPPASEAAQTQTRLLLAATSARAGDTVLAGVELRMPAKWHTYWRNAGESGAPTRIDWTLPEGIVAGEMLWPAPEKYLSAGLTTYVYHREVVLLVPLRLAANLPAGPVSLKAKVSWLECAELCLPGKAELEARLTIGPDPTRSAEAELLESWQKKVPRAEPKLAATAAWEQPPANDKRPLILTWTPTHASAEYDFFPYGAETYEVEGATESLKHLPGGVSLRKMVNKFNGDWPKEITGLLIEQTGPNARTAYEVKLPLSDAPPTIPEPGSAATAPQVKTTPSLPGMLGLAFLGGLILNIMPCVLPVIALKILGFVRQSREAPGQVKRLGLIYGLGVLASFLVLAGLVIAAQQAGRAASWGMQFQNPQFVVVMTTLVTLVALNLFGVFEVGLGGRTMSAADGLAAREGGAGAFFNGVLATALATPCTAPFLAVALGFAFSQPPQIIVLMFLVMGLGLAAPYVLLSWFPSWLKVLPKPGAWMEKFKVAMGFPMLATAVWLLTLTTPHFGSSGPLWLGLFLVFVALAAWIWGEFAQRGRHAGFALAVSLAFLLAGYGYALERELDWRSPAAPGNAKAPTRPSGAAIDWQPWSDEAVTRARAAGRPVLVDFTADWCVTCQANKKTSLEIPSVRQKLKETATVALLGDYTREDPAITRELRRFQRAGVPLVLVYPPEPQAPPIVLPSLLTPGIVLEALDKASNKM